MFVASVQRQRWTYFLPGLWGWLSSPTQHKNSSSGSVQAKLRSPNQVNVVTSLMQPALVPLHCIPQLFLEGSLPWAQHHVNMLIWHWAHSCCSEPKLNLHWLSMDWDTNNVFPAFSLSPPLLVNREFIAFIGFIQQFQWHHIIYTYRRYKLHQDSANVTGRQDNNSRATW